MSDRDQSIIDAFLRGDPQAVATISVWIAQVIRCKSWNHLFDADDIIQETLVAVLVDLRRQTYRGEGLRAFVQRVSSNKCVDIIRRHGRNPVDSGLNDCDVPDGLPTAEDNLEMRQQIRFAETVLAELNPADRQLLRWLCIEGLDRRTIARLLGISDGALRKRICDCLKRAGEVRARMEKR
ncbi:MAG: sigma-70 family RNA polymerase sigma factor [candidate division Zixibacteria bacterium]|nr:sigma-70 family RNA polymerase sigma factor [candidate division Zixibacteria bacterium]